MAEPKQITAGLSYAWSKSLADYLASASWTLKYSIVNSSAQYDITATADGDDFDVAITKALSVEYAPGAYRLIGYVDDGTDRHQIYCGDLIVAPDFTAVADLRSFAETTLDAIEAMIGKAATKDQQSIMVDGQTLVRRSIPDLITLRDRFKREVQSEKRAAKFAGLGNARTQVRLK